MAAPRKHVVMVASVPFEVDTCYSPFRLLGRGAYGLVAEARVVPEVAVPSEEEGVPPEEQVAIKKIANIFRGDGDDAKLIEAKRTLREICLLRHMSHENVLSIRDVLVPADPLGFADAYIVVEKMDSDMHKIIASKQPLSCDHRRFFMYQLLRGLKYLHSAGVIHRDLKPGNLLLNANCDLKISDFGLARTVEPDAECKLTQYVVTRWYRAPEILLLNSNYTTAVDIWSAGCIFGELFTRRPLFRGHSHLHQLHLIETAVGAPPPGAKGAMPPKVVQTIRSAMASASAQLSGDARPQPLSALLPMDASPAARDLLSKLLQFDPDSRLTAEEALAHPYLADLHEEEAEPVAQAPLALEVDDGDDHDWEQLRDIYCSVAHEYLEARDARVAAYRARQGSSITTTAAPAGEGGPVPPSALTTRTTSTGAPAVTPGTAPAAAEDEERRAATSRKRPRGD